LRFVDSVDANAVAGVNQDVVVNGSGFGGLKFTASARPNSLFGGGIADPVGNDAKLASVLTAARLSRVTGAGGYLTPAPTGATFQFPSGGMWSDSDVGLRISDHNASGVDVSLAALTSWSRNLAVDAGAVLEVGMANAFSFNEGTIHGKGIISSAGSIRIEAPGAISPGFGDLGTLTMQGNVELLGSLSIDVAPTVADVLSISGNLSLGGTLKLGGAIGTSDVTIANYGGALIGEFSAVIGLPPDFVMDYGSGTNGTITLKCTEQPTLVWAGGTAEWNTSSANWRDGRVFAHRNKVVFDDTSTGSPMLRIVGEDVMPNLVVVDNDSRHYTLESSTGAALAGTAQLIKKGTGMLTLRGSARYTGGTLVQHGILRLGSNDALPDFGPVVIESCGTLQMRGFDDTVGDLIVNGTIEGGNSTLRIGSLVLDGTAVVEPDLVLKGGVTKLGGNELHLDGSIDLAGGARSIIVQSASLTLSGNVTNGAVVKSGPGELRLSGTNSHASTTVEGGTLMITAPGALPAGSDVFVSSGSSSTLKLNGFVSSLGILNSSGVVDLGSLSLSVRSLSGLGGELRLAANVLTVNQDGDTGYGGVIGGSGSLLKLGTGILRLTGANTFSGGATVSGGILSLAAPSAGGTGVLTVNTGGALDLSAGIANDIVLNGGLLGSSIGLPFDGSLNVVASSRMMAADPKNPAVGNDLLLTKALHGLGALMIQGATSVTGADGAAGVRLRYVAPSSYTGIITVLQSTKFELQTASAASASPAGTGKIVLVAGTLLSDRAGTYSQFNLRNDNTDGEARFGNDVAVEGMGFVNLNLTGAGIVNRLGNLRIQDGQTLGVNRSEFNPATVTFASVTLAGGVAAFAPNTIAMSYTGSAELVLGPISETIANSGLRMEGTGVLYLDKPNAYTGPTILAAGTTYLGAEGALPAATALIMAGGSLDLEFPNRGSYSQTVSSLSGSAGLIANGDFTTARTLTVNQATDTNYDGLLLGNLGLAKQGSGKLTLSGTNLYSRDTVVDGGTLEITGSIGGAGVSVGSNGTLAGTGTIDTGISVHGKLAPGVSGPGILTLNGGSLMLGPASQSLLEIRGTNQLFDIDRVVGIGTLTLDGTFSITLADRFMPAAGDAFDLFDAAVVFSQNFDVRADLVLPGLSDGLSWDSGAFVSSGVLFVVPEPTSAHVLIGVIVAGMVFQRRRAAVKLDNPRIFR
jgi:fibronectin-binding autotransporter adhesin